MRPARSRGRTWGAFPAPRLLARKQRGGRRATAAADCPRLPAAWAPAGAQPRATSWASGSGLGRRGRLSGDPSQARPVQRPLHQRSGRPGRDVSVPHPFALGRQDLERARARGAVCAHVLNSPHPWAGGGEGGGRRAGRRAPDRAGPDPSAGQPVGVANSGAAALQGPALAPAMHSLGVFPPPAAGGGGFEGQLGRRASRVRPAVENPNVP